MKKADKVGKRVEYYKCQKCGKVWKNPPAKPQGCSCGAGEERIKDYQED